MKSKQDFVHLHVHSDMSQLDGCGKIADYVKKAKEHGSNAIAFTEHGTMRGYYQQLLECQENDMKPIYGIEFYVANDMNRKGLTPEEKADITSGLKRGEHKAAIKEYEEKHGIRDRYHLTVLAKNKEGMKNLFKLSTKGYLEGFYYKPRIDVPALIEHREGLIVLTGCVSSCVYDHISVGKEKRAIQEADRLYEAFGDDLWIETMPHSYHGQYHANKFAMTLRDRWGNRPKLVATQDAHYVDPTDWDAHEALLCIGTNDSMSNPDRFKFGDGELYLQTRKEMYNNYMKNHSYMGKKFIKEALNNTLEIANIIESNIVEIDRFACLVPPVYVPDKHNGNNFEYIKELCIKGWSWRNIPDRAKAYAKKQGMSEQQAITIYKGRLKKELTALKQQKFIEYFLLVRELYDWVRKQDIMCGPGRGSAAGSMVSYLLGITSVDPIEHGLLFERFISPSRIDMPDIDMDFEDVRRQEIIEHLRQKYGEDKVCQIATVGKLSGKQCLKDVSRVLEVPYAEVNAVTNSIIERSSGDERASQTIADSFKEFKVCREFNKKHPGVLRYASRLEGMAKNLGIHAAGVVTSPVPLSEIVPLEIRKHDGRDIVVSAIDMYGVASQGLLKLDVLGLRTLTVLNDCVKMVKERHGVEIDLEHIDLNIPEVLKGFTDHEYVGVFQYDSPGADKICAGVNFETFEDVAAMTALNRPGTARSGLASQYVARKKNPKERKKGYLHDKVSEITSDTLGIIVYQEHVLRIFTEIAGFEPATADSLRKKIAKKWGDETIGKERENFIKGAKKTIGMDERTAGKLMDAITFFGSYGFNKSHATAYGIIAYWGMYLKVYYPLEFYWALLKNEPTRLRIQAFAKDAKRHGIELLPPSVDVSKKHFAIDGSKNAIRGSLIDIKGVGEAAAATIIEQQPFDSLLDMYNRVDRRKCHRGVFLALAKAGALDEHIPNLKWFIENVVELWAELGKKGGTKKAKSMIDASKELPDYPAEEKQLIASQVNPLAFGKHPIDAYQDFMDHNVAVPTESMSDEDFFKKNDGKGVYIAGVIVEVKYNQIGDFHTGELPSELERARMFWGRRYANVNIEDVGGKQNRVKFDIDVFDDMRDVIDAGIGTPVVAHVTPNKRFENLRGHFMVNLESYRKNVAEAKQLTIWERLISGKHPALDYPWKPTNKKTKEQVREDSITNKKFYQLKERMYCGVVTNVMPKYDKNGGQMAFFGMLGADGAYIECICFASAWDANVSNAIRPGRLLQLTLSRQKDSRDHKKWQHLFNGGKIVWRKNQPTETG